MVKIGTRLKSKKEQAVDAELGLIIDEMGNAMREANRTYVSQPPKCRHDNVPRFTLHMDLAWSRYVEFCQEHPDE